MITLKDIQAVEHEGVKTLSSKIIYLMINKDEGWSPISLTEFSKATGLTRQAVIQCLKRLQASGLIEKRSSPNATNHYRTTRKL